MKVEIELNELILNAVEHEAIVVEHDRIDEGAVCPDEVGALREGKPFKFSWVHLVMFTPEKKKVVPLLVSVVSGRQNVWLKLLDKRRPRLSLHSILKRTGSSAG